MKELGDIIKEINEIKNHKIYKEVMKTNYKHISKEDFENSVADHLSYLIKQKKTSLEKTFDTSGELELNFENWKEYRVGDILKPINGKGITAEEIEENTGFVPCVQGGAENNGVLGFIAFEYIKNKKFATIYEDCLTVARVGTSGQINFQQEICCIGDKAKALILLDKYHAYKNKYVYLFLKAVLQFLKYKYCYGRGIVTETYMNESIKLPTKNNEPDWQFMEDYIKSLSYADRI